MGKTMRPGKAAMQKFVAKVKKELDAKLYTQFTSFTRISDKVRYARNDSVAVEVIQAGKKILIQEKIVHKKVGQPLFWEIMHLNKDGMVVPAPVMGSKANLIVYTIWDDEKGCIDRIAVLSVKKLRDLAYAEYSIYKEGKPNCLSITTGEALHTGDTYKVMSFPFYEDELPEDIYVLLGGKRITL